MEYIDTAKLPQHIAIIMDGNGRWAKSRGLSRTQGHREGVKRVEEIVEIARIMGVKVLTLFTFSTENWQRPKKEVMLLMAMITSKLNKKIEKLRKVNIRFQIMGRTDLIPKEVLKALKAGEKKTKNNSGMIMNLAFNYGGRIEIIDAVKNIAKSVQEGALDVEDICEETISQNLYTQGLPDPDLLIRTSGEQRISNFLLWQLSYAELYFTDKNWPEFNKDEFEKAILDFQRRERRFGSV